VFLLIILLSLWIGVGLWVYFRYFYSFNLLIYLTIVKQFYTKNSSSRKHEITKEEEKFIVQKMRDVVNLLTS
jgi:hypothetical protein